MHAKSALNLARMGYEAYFFMKNKEAIQDVFYMAAGLAAIGKNKIDELSKEIKEHSDITEKEGKEFIEEINTKFKSIKNEFNIKTDEIVKKVLKQLQIATKEDIKKIENQIEQLKF